jgi:hypothetical protein
MNKTISKFGALLAVFALFASLMVSIPVGAASTPDIYIKSVGVPTTAPTIGDNITVTATIRAANATACKNVTVNFYAVNGTSSTAISTILVVGPVKNTADWIVNGSWNSTKTGMIPNGDLVYTIKAVASMAGETNLTNNTKNSTSTVDWKAPKLQAFGMTGAATALIGDMYTGTVSVKNIGDASFVGVQVMNVMEGSDILDTIEVNGTGTAVAASAVKVYDYEVNTTTWTAADAGEHNFTFSYGGADYFVVATFTAKATNVYVTSITFIPGLNLKGTQVVNITASFKNNGTLDAVNDPVTFSVNNVDLTCSPAATVSVVKGDVVEEIAWCLYTTPTSTVTKNYLVNVSVDSSIMNKTLTVLPTPHTVLGIAGIAITPTTLVAKDKPTDTQDITIAVTVTNTGDLAAVNAVVKIYAGADVIYTNNTVNVTVNGQTTVTYVYAIATTEDDRNVTITANVSLGTDIKELAKNVTVPGDVDLPVYSFVDLTAAPTLTQERGLKTTLTVKVKNVGDALGSTITLKFKAGTSDIGTKTLVNLTAGAEGNTTTLEWTIPSTFTPLGKIDINVTIDGTTVFKNMSYTIIEIKKPSVAVEFVKEKNKVKSYSSSAADGKSKTLKVQVTLVNTGNADAKNLRVDIKNSKGVSIANATGISVPAGQTVTQTIEVKMKAGTSTKLTADIIYDGIHGLAGIDKGLTDSSTAADSPSAKVVKTPGFEGVILVAAVAVALVVLSRRKKN